MPMERIPFAPAQESGWEELSGAGQEAYNVIIDGKGAVRRRPGIKEYFDTAGTVLDATGISGLHQTSGGKLFAVSDANRIKTVYSVSKGGINELGEILGEKRPTFAETQTLLVIAAGSSLYKVNIKTLDLDKLGGDPPKSTHVIAQASRLLNVDLDTDLRNNFNYSAPQAGAGITGYETWNGTDGSDSGPFSANARPDPIEALHENTNEVFAFGKTNVQNFAPDPNSVYAKVNTREFGCAAPYSVVKDDQNFAWIDDKRRIVHSDGRTFNVLSDPIKQVLDNMDDLSDAFGYRVVRGPVDVLVWTFPSDGRTFAYQRGGGWAQWAGWNSTGNRFKQFPVTAAVRQLSDGAYVCGTDTGRMGVFLNSAAQDLGEDIAAHVTTGFINRKTQSRKHCRSLRITMKRGQSTGENVAAQVSWRDDLGKWGQPLAVTLGKEGDPEVVVRFYSLGVYRERQWRFSFQGSEDLILANVSEEYEVLSD